MALPIDSVNMALFCDFENIALGVRDTKFEKFDIKPVLEKLLLKGSIVVKKAYCDWDRYKTFKAAMHEASFELIEIPHVRQSGKNSADIRLVVDALDLCYTKSHVDTFVIISGDSDFSPLVSKLRENAKRVIGVGVKNSTSDLLVANCDEFIFYDDLAREQQRALAKREARGGGKRPAEDGKPRGQEGEGRSHDGEARKAEAITLAAETFEALVAERGESGKIWASALKSAIKRRKPDFNESYYGFRAFGNLLDEAQARGLLEVGRDDKSGAFVYRSNQPASADTGKTPDLPLAHDAPAKPAEEARADKKSRGKNRRTRDTGDKAAAQGHKGAAANQVMQAAAAVLNAAAPAPAWQQPAATRSAEVAVETSLTVAETVPARVLASPDEPAAHPRADSRSATSRRKAAPAQSGGAAKDEAAKKRTRAASGKSRAKTGNATDAAPADVSAAAGVTAPPAAEPAAAQHDALAPAVKKKAARKTVPRARQPRAAKADKAGQTE